MAANFNLPTVDTTYTAFPTQIIENIDAALQMLSVGSPSNIPDGAIKWDADNNKFVKSFIKRDNKNKTRCYYNK